MDFNSADEKGPPRINVSGPRGEIVDGGRTWIGDKMGAWSGGDGRIGS
jgi:hypothetical protein